MRIAIISTPHVPTPPAGYGASELIAGLLAEGLQRRGHHVRLFATQESTARVAELCSYPEVAIAETFDQRELVHVARALGNVDDCDVVHNHCLAAGPPFFHVSKRPFLTTLHYVHPVARAVPDANYVAVSDRQRSLLPDLHVIDRVYNGIDLSSFTPGTHRGDYLAFLGRFHPIKGVDIAIDVARRLGQRLVIAAPSPPDDKRDWFNAKVRPYLGGRIEWIGPVEGAQRSKILGDAIATLIPIRWEEPFGLVLIESMACGTPPIAFARGAAPEIIQDRKTGFLVHTVPEMVAAVSSAPAINPEECRRYVENRFSMDRMVDAYLSVYNKARQFELKST